MVGTRPILFGIAVILASGFTLVHDLIRQGREYGPNTEFAQIGLVVGLVIDLFGLLFGASSEGSGTHEKFGVSDFTSTVSARFPSHTFEYRPFSSKVRVNG